MKEYFSFAVGFLFLLMLILSNLFYFSRIIPTLNKYGQKNGYEILPSKQWKQVWEYKKICAENKLPLFYSYFMIGFPFIALALLTLWIILSL
jgi:hypothetical protein